MPERAARRLTDGVRTRAVALPNDRGTSPDVRALTALDDGARLFKLKRSPDAGDQAAAAGHSIFRVRMAYQHLGRWLGGPWRLNRWHPRETGHA